MIEAKLGADGRGDLWKQITEVARGTNRCCHLRNIFKLLGAALVLFIGLGKFRSAFLHSTL